jgi:LuxR family maltose regulon positive regulatory protein
MSDDLIQTKIRIPNLTAQCIDRHRLARRLDSGKNAALMLVSAPAGFGKTTLLGTWAKNLNENIAWLSLDSDLLKMRRQLSFSGFLSTTYHPGCML